MKTMKFFLGAMLMACIPMSSSLSVPLAPASFPQELEWRQMAGCRRLVHLGIKGIARI